jgi:hypothetical protein
MTKSGGSMNKIRKKTVLRGALTLLILLSGLAMLPFVKLPTQAINWELFAGVYAPELSVNATSGAPGSVFAFTGSSYPGNAIATVYVNGVSKGTVMTDDTGTATFLINAALAQPGLYNITLEVDINASATQSIELIAGGDIIQPPDEFQGPVFFLGNPVFLPIIQN